MSRISFFTQQTKSREFLDIYYEEVDKVCLLGTIYDKWLTCPERGRWKCPPELLYIQPTMVELNILVHC